MKHFVIIGMAAGFVLVGAILQSLHIIERPASWSLYGFAWGYVTAHVVDCLNGGG